MGTAPADDDQDGADHKSPGGEEEHADEAKDFQSDAERILLAAANDRGDGCEFAGKPEGLAALRTVRVGTNILFQIAQDVTAKPASAGECRRTQCAILSGNCAARESKSALFGEALEFGSFVSLVQPGGEFLELLVNVSFLGIPGLIAQKRFERVVRFFVFTHAVK